MASPPEVFAADNQASVIVCCVEAARRPGTVLSAGMEDMVEKKVWLVR